MAPPGSRIGFIGLGAMGTGMATRLVHAGFEVRGFDVRAEAVRRLASAGGRAAASAAEAAADADLCIVMVATPGIGSTVKMVNQLLAGVHIAAAAEAMALGARAGADPRVLFEVISKSAGRSWMFENRVPHMLAGDYTPLSALDIFVKDLGIVLEAGKVVRFPLPLAAAAHQLYLMGAAAGLGREDDSAVVKVFEKLTGISVARGADPGAEARAPLRAPPRSAAGASRETPPRPRGARRSRRPPRRR